MFASQYVHLATLSYLILSQFFKNNVNILRCYYFMTFYGISPYDF